MNIVYRGMGDVEELKSIASQLSVHLAEHDLECVMTEIAPYEWNLDQPDLDYIQAVLSSPPRRWIP